MTIGIVGGGQLGRMLILAGVPLGLRFRVLDPVPEAATDGLAPRVAGDFDDFAALAEFHRGLDCATYEFENVPVTSARWLADRLPVFPPPDALAVAQDRVAEKQFFRDLSIPTPAFRAVQERAEYDDALAEIGLPAVLKTRRFGYDGKGQRVLTSPADCARAWEQLGGRPLILEKFIPFTRELSIVAVRGRSGESAAYPLAENRHRNGILARSLAPAGTDELQSEAEDFARRVLDRLSYVGVLAIEFFELDGHLIANEMAPRVHNSGHWTIDGAATSQFENHLRALAGWPLGSTVPTGHAAMFNLIGTLPALPPLLAVPGAHLHLYGKSPRPGRKLGHVTIVAPTRGELEHRLEHPALKSLVSEPESS